MLILLGLIVATQTLAAPTKSEMMVITKEQWDSLNNKLGLWAYAFIAFIAKEIWESFKNRGKSLADIEKSISAINETIKGLATREDARRIARDEVKHYDDLQR